MGVCGDHPRVHPVAQIAGPILDVILDPILDVKALKNRAERTDVDSVDDRMSSAGGPALADPATRRLQSRAAFDPMSGSWPMIGLNVVAVLLVMIACALTADAVAEGAWVFPVYVALSAAALFGLIALPLRYFLMQQRREADTREALLGAESGRREFDSRLVRALDMAADESSVLEVAVRAIQTRTEGTCAEVLLADSSRAHLSRAASTSDPACSGTCQCSVATPRECPAVRSGHALSFDDSDAFDTCPHLRNRGPSPISAICIPVSVMGSSVGVVHSVRPASQGFVADERTALASVAQQLGSRLGLVRAMSQSEVQANTDPLTGLLNRRSLENQARRLVHDGRSFSVVLADLDHFKVLNDTHGHDVGDRALRLFAQVLKRTFRDVDLVCRYGGEEFLVVLPGTRRENAAAVMSRVHLELMTAVGDGRTPPFTFSSGVSDSDETAALADLVTLADSRLLHAKSTGRNRTVTGMHTGTEAHIPSDAAVAADRESCT